MNTAWCSLCDCWTDHQAAKHLTPATIEPTKGPDMIETDVLRDRVLVEMDAALATILMQNERVTAIDFYLAMAPVPENGQLAFAIAGLYYIEMPSPVLGERISQLHLQAGPPQAVTSPSEVKRIARDMIEVLRQLRANVLAQGNGKPS